MRDELPQGWTLAKLGELSQPTRPRLNPRESPRLPFVGMEQVEPHTRRLLGTIEAAEMRSAGVHFLPGDVLYGRLRPYLNKVYCSDIEGICSGEFIVLPSTGAFDSKYLAFYLSTDGFVSFANQLNQGDRPRVSFAQIAHDQVPLPPLAEQHRIVQTLDAFLAKVDACKQRLDKIPVLMKRFRQSVLAAACSGRLTEDWRNATGDGHKSQERGGETGLPEIPDTWRWAKLSEIGEMSRGKSRHRPRQDPSLFNGRYPFIQTGSIAQSGGRIISHTRTYNDAGLAQSRLWPAGTICVTIAANIAESAILTYPTCFPDSVVGIIANPKACVGEYIEYFIRTAKADLSTFAPATAQKNINIAILNDLSVPLPPIDEQKEIVRRVGALFGLASQIEYRYATARKRVDQLTPSLLAKAFRGELVPTEAGLARTEGRDYEPASVLLERIRAERGAAKGPAAKRTRGTGAKRARRRA